jgi:hypothetical protein
LEFSRPLPGAFARLDLGFIAFVYKRGVSKGTESRELVDEHKQHLLAKDERINNKPTIGVYHA